MIILMEYRVSCAPGQSDSGSTTSQGSIQVGCWALPVDSLNINKVLTALRDCYATPLIEQQKEGTLNGWDALKLKAIRQVRQLLLDYGKKTLTEGTIQQMEALEHGFLNVVHNISISVVDNS